MGNCVPVFQLRTGRSFPQSLLSETMSHSGSGFRDALSATDFSWKAHPTLDANSGMHFPRRRWLPAVVVFGFFARIEFQHAAAVFAYGELGALQAATLALGQLGRVDLVSIGLIGK